MLITNLTEERTNLQLAGRIYINQLPRALCLLARGTSGRDSLRQLRSQNRKHKSANLGNRSAVKQLIYLTAPPFWVITVKILDRGYKRKTPLDHPLYPLKPGFRFGYFGLF